VENSLCEAADPASSGETFGPAWLAGKKRLRPSSSRRLDQIGAHWLLPVLADVPLKRLAGRHCAADSRIEDINEEITAARGEERAPVLARDVRNRPQHVGIATQHRVYATLREFLNHAWKQRHVIRSTLSMRSRRRRRRRGGAPGKRPVPGLQRGRSTGPDVPGSGAARRQAR
jgi:hypothetical protein